MCSHLYKITRVTNILHFLQNCDNSPLLYIYKYLASHPEKLIRCREVMGYIYILLCTRPYGNGFVFGGSPPFFRKNTKRFAFLQRLYVGFGFCRVLTAVNLTRGLRPFSYDLRYVCRDNTVSY